METPKGPEKTPLVVPEEPNTVSLNVLTEEDATFLGRTPLGKFKSYLEEKIEHGIVKLDFSNNGFITDAVLKVLRDVLCKHADSDNKCLSTLTTVDLTGCFNITDTGLHWVAEVLARAPHVLVVQLDGCTKITDNGFSAIFNAKPNALISAMATSLTHINRGPLTQGCPLLTDSENSRDRAEMCFGHCLIIPHSEVEMIFADYLHKKMLAARKEHQLKYVKDCSIGKWTVALTEVELTNPAFDVLVPDSPVQVIMPVKCSTEPDMIKKHVISTITRILTKETMRPAQLEGQLTALGSRNNFLDTHVMQKLYYTPGGTIRNISVSERVIGVFVSQQPLSRTNNYYEVEAVSHDGTKEVGLVMGCMFDVLYSTRFPMESGEAKGGAVEGFEFAVGDVFGFGIEGIWESEYVPKQDACSYYFTKNGTRVQVSVKEIPHIGMYPVVSVLGKGTAEIKLRNLNSPPQDLVEAWEKDKKTFQACFLHNILCDDQGVLSYIDSYKSTGEVGLCVNQLPITKANNSLTIRIVNTGKNGAISVGLGPENLNQKIVVGDTEGSLGFHCKNGKLFVNGKEEGSFGQPLNKGQTVNITVTGFTTDTIEPEQSHQVQISVDGKQVSKCNFTYKQVLGNRCVFLINMESKGEKVEVLNFRQAHRSKPPTLNMLTMGRSHFIDVFDDGTLHSRPFGTRKLFGLFVSKTPLNSQLSYFEMEILDSSINKHLGIGLCHKDYLINQMPGWLYGSVAYHADNGQMYMNSAQGSKTITSNAKEMVYGKGDVVGCGIDVDKAKFRADGTLTSQQTLLVYFTKNSKRVHEVKFEYLSDGLFPCVAIHHPEDKVRLRNYYPGCYALGAEEADMKEKTSKKVEEKTNPEGCQFLVVGVGGKEDKTQLQKVEDLINLKEDLTAVPELRTEIQQLERNLDTLDFQGHQYYSQLCWNLECLERFCKQKTRLKFLTINTDTGEGYDSVVQHIAASHDEHRKNYPLQYSMHTKVKQGLDKIVSTVENKSIMYVSQLQESTENVLDTHGHVYEQAAKLLYRMGQLLYLKHWKGDVVFEVRFLVKVMDKVKSMSQGQPDPRATAVSPGSPVWMKEKVFSAGKLNQQQVDILSELLPQLGLLKVACLRTDTADPSVFFARPAHLIPADVKTSDYWSHGSKPKDCACMWKTYNFWSGIPSGLLTAVVVECSKFSRLQLVQEDGAVLQNGAVQTTIIKHTTQKGDALTVESKCFVPDRDVGPIQEDTRFNVEEYTWNVFCILTDVVDSHIHDSSLSPIIERNVPANFTNTSIGCRHEFAYSESDITQSVCTLCELCCDKGPDCKWNGIMGYYLRQCRCGTNIGGCKSCGICVRCAQHLWTLRSLLRPCCFVSVGDKTDLLEAIPLNGTTFNQVEIVNLQKISPSICLKKQNDISGALIQAFPGPAVEIPERAKLKEYNKNASFPSSLKLSEADTITVKLEELQRSKSFLQDLEEEDDILDIKPVYYTLICREARVWHDVGIVCYDSPSRSVPVAQFVATRPLTPECNKFSVEIVNPGESRYIGIGLVHKRYAMNRQPGWDPSSIGYHADDGGVFTGSGWPLRRVGAVQVGEVMTCELNIEEQKVIFYKNDKQVYTSHKLRIPAGGFYPCVGLHSPGEAIRLLDMDVWLPPKEGEVQNLPQAFDTYKYGNLWISPGLSVLLQREKNKFKGWLLLHNPSKDLVGFVVKSDAALLDPPLMGYLDPGKSRTNWIAVPHTDADIKNMEVSWFSLDSGKSYTDDEIQQIYLTLTSESLHTHKLKVKLSDTQISNVVNLKRATGEPMSKDKYKMTVSRNGSVVDSYYLQDGKYSCVISQEEKETARRILIKCPKYPTFDLPSSFQRGMRLIAKPAENTFAECVISNVTPDNIGMTLEFSPRDADVNTLLCVESDSTAVHLEELPVEVIQEMSTVIKGEKEAKKGDKSEETKGGNAAEQDNVDTAAKKGLDLVLEPKESVEHVVHAGEFSLLTRSRQMKPNIPETDPEDSKKSKEKMEKKEIVKADVEIYGFETRGNMAMEKRAYMFPPPCLLTQASRYAINALDSGWKMHSLQSIAKCYAQPTRITVQELQIMQLSRKLWTWVRGHAQAKSDSKIEQGFAFLPASLNVGKLLYHQVPKMFEDIEVHRLCFLVDELYQIRQEEMDLDIPIHFVDMPPIKPEQALAPDLMYGCLFAGWTYTVLVSTKLQLPICDKLFSGGKPDFSRSQVETMLSSLLRVYTAQCHILAEQHGGMDLQDGYQRRTHEIQKNIRHSDTHVQRYQGQLVDDPSIMLMRKFRNHLMCKAHQLTNEQGNIMGADEGAEFQYKHEYFEPYQETVHAFCRELPHQTDLPEDFFLKFPNLQVVYLDQCYKLTSIPSGVSKCQRIKVLCITNSAVTELPSDMFLAPEIKHLLFSSLPVKNLPTQWPPSSQLTHLQLSGLQLTNCPSEIGQLQELTYLDLGYNPLANLPLEVGNLKKLRVLNISGMPWLTTGGTRPTLPLDQYDMWFEDHPYIQAYLPNLNPSKIFDKQDVSKNGVMDAEGLAELNCKLFWEIPRMGCSAIGDAEYGGIPPCVFLLTSLEELYLKHTAITAVPVHMCRLVNLRILCLDHNPLLESLPGSLGHLPNITSLDLIGCPSLRTPPNEVVSRGFDSVKAYLKRLAGGFTACRRTKLMLVGLGGAGKTSLLKALMSQNKKSEGTKGEAITDGIVIQPWTVKTQDDIEITYNTWDFAGQTLYYNTHQFFLSKRAVYILLWSTRQGFEHAGLDFWLSSIACHAPKTPIFVVGTHCDQVPKADIPMALLTRRYPQIAGFHFISSILGTGVSELEEDLMKVTLEQKNMGEKIPQVWLNLEKKILAARTETSILKWSVIKDYGMEVGIYDEKDIREAIQFLHELGTVQYFDNDFLRDQVVINPQWIVNVMSCVVSVKNSPIQDSEGRFLHKHIGDVWKSYPETLHKWLLQLTEEFDLTFPLPKEPTNIVPCLLPQEEPQELDLTLSNGSENTRQTKMVYKFAYLPAGLFNRAQVRLFQFSDGKLIWKRGSLLKKNNHTAIIRQTSDSELVVQVQGPRPENILFLVHEIFESLIEESFHGVVYDYLVPCPDCVMKEGCLDPCMFESGLVSHAKDHKAPFLQCRKNFHTVSMAQLLEIMPSDHASDFDAHLQHSIMMLQELNSALTTDVAILYSALDVPAPKQTGDKIHPQWVKDDLEKCGLSCWFAEDMLGISVQDLTLGLKNCKVIVALVSDNFERDEKCRDMMLYAMDTLQKDYVIIVIGSSLAWQNTDLGMRIGKQEQMVMVKTKSRYEERTKEMEEIVKTKLQGIHMRDTKEYPVCFVSYCWSNSQDAVSKGTKSKPGALGWADPRALKKYLEDNGISTWIDCEQTAMGKGLFENICKGMRHAKVLLVCVSDEYVESENCMMELRFGVLNLGLQLVLAVVGTGSEWKFSEVGILAQRARASKVYFQKDNPGGMDTLLTYVRERLPHKQDSLIRKEEVKKEMSKLQKQACKQTNVVLQEEYELTQRRFMRHIISFVSSMDTSPLPRLIIIDFEKTERVTSIRSERVSSMLTPVGAGSSSRKTVRSTMASFSIRENAVHSPGREHSKDSLDKSSFSSRPTLRPKTATRSRERMEVYNPDSEEWESHSFCIKLLCEFEEGWHVCDTSFPIRKTEDFHNNMKKVAPYLARIFAILRQSSVQLNCFTAEYGVQFLEWLEKESQGSDFLEAYQAIRAILQDHELAATAFINQLSRCHLPSGKVYWLCEKHQSGPRITKLRQNVGTRLNQRRVVFREDILLKELIETSDTYRKKKRTKYTAKKIELPSVSSVTKASGKSLDHTPSRSSLSGKPVMDNSANNMAPLSKQPEKKPKISASPPPKMHPVNRSSGKSKFKAAGTTVDITNTTNKTVGKNEKSKACSIQ